MGASSGVSVSVSGGEGSATASSLQQPLLSSAVAAALPTMHTLRLAGGGGAGAREEAPVAAVAGLAAAARGLGAAGGKGKMGSRGVTLSSELARNELSEELGEDAESARLLKRRGVLGKVLAAVGTVISLAAITAGAAFAAAVLNARLDDIEHAAHDHHHLQPKQRQQQSKGGQGASLPEAPYLPPSSSALEVFRG